MNKYTTAQKIKLSGFNNLTKILSFNLYDFCITFDDKQKEEYINWINEKYSAEKIIQISRKICEIIQSDIISESKMDYEPVGASTMTLMSDIQGGKWENVQANGNGYKAHLTKSHLTSHTYPDASDPDGICTYRVDFDIATCGDIIPLKAINYLFEAFECDVVYIDYVVRGYTRLDDGKKIYNDHDYFNSIQDFIDPKILKNYLYHSDLNIPRDNIWQTKLMVKEFGPERFVFNQNDINREDIDHKMANLYEEMREVFHLH